MDFKNILSQLGQLSEAVKDTGKGKIHTAEPGGYGRKDDEDDEGKKVKSDAPKKGRGRPKKDADASGETKTYDTKTLGSAFGGGKKPAKEIGKVSKKHSLKEYFDQLEQALNEGETIEKKGGRVHKGTYGTSHEAGDDVKKTAVQRGRGRPKKDADETGEVKNYDFSAFGAKKGVKLPAWDKSKTTKHTMKEAEQIQIKPASQMPRTPGQSSMPGQQQVQGQPKKDTQVIAQGNKTLGTVDNPQLAQQIKQSIGRGEMTLMPDGTMEEGLGDMARKVGGVVKKVGNAALDKLGHGSDEDLIRQMQKNAGMPQTGKKPMPTSSNEVDEASYSATAARAGKDIGKPGKQFSQIAKSAGERYGSAESGKKVAGAVLAKLRGKTNEADIPSHDGDMGAGLGAGRGQGMLEGKKPDFLDVDKDNNKKESWTKAEQDKKKSKQKVKEGMDHRLKAAHHAGKSHALSKQSYNCTYDDMEESRMYHDGFKEGLDECYSMIPTGGMVDEMGQSTVDDMASFGALHSDDVEEGNAFTSALASTPRGQKFSVGGRTFTDRTSYDAPVDETMFESWNNELTSLLEEYKDITEGVSISASQGQQGSPDSVSVTATEGDADKVMALIKQLGIVGLGNEQEPNGYGAVDGAASAQGGIEVVDDHDGMMALMKKLTGQGGEEGGEMGGSEDYADEVGSEEPGHDHEEGHEEGHEEEICDSCGSAECGCDSEEQMVDEVESEDQMEYEVAEDNPPDSGAAETEEEVQDTAQANKSAAEYDAAENDDEEEQVTEWANDAGENSKDFDDESFRTDIDFMTNIISGGLNKQKATGQTTIPVVASQLNRQITSESRMINESVYDLKMLAGIKK